MANDAKVKRLVAIKTRMAEIEKEHEKLKEEHFKLMQKCTPAQLNEALRKTQHIWNR